MEARSARLRVTIILVLVLARFVTAAHSRIGILICHAEVPVWAMRDTALQVSVCIRVRVALCLLAITPRQLRVLEIESICSITLAIALQLLLLLLLAAICACFLRRFTQLVSCQQRLSRFVVRRCSFAIVSFASWRCCAGFRVGFEPLIGFLRAQDDRFEAMLEQVSSAVGRFPEARQLATISGLQKQTVETRQGRIERVPLQVS